MAIKAGNVVIATPKKYGSIKAQKFVIINDMKLTAFINNETLTEPEIIASEPQVVAPPKTEQRQLINTKKSSPFFNDLTNYKFRGVK
jgi:hypothetical protein